jgi:hypothetical protein
MILFCGSRDERKEADFVGVAVRDMGGMLADNIFVGHFMTSTAGAATLPPRTFAAEDEATAYGKRKFAQVIFLEKALAGNVGGNDGRRGSTMNNRLVGGVGMRINIISMISCMNWVSSRP